MHLSTNTQWVRAVTHSPNGLELHIGQSQATRVTWCHSTTMYKNYNTCMYVLDGTWPWSSVPSICSFNLFQWIWNSMDSKAAGETTMLSPSLHVCCMYRNNCPSPLPYSFTCNGLNGPPLPCNATCSSTSVLLTADVICWLVPYMAGAAIPRSPSCPPPSYHLLLQPLQFWFLSLASSVQNNVTI